MTVRKFKVCACGHADSLHETDGKKRGRCLYGHDEALTPTRVAPCPCMRFHRRASPASVYAEAAPSTAVHVLTSREPEVLAALDDIIAGFTRLRRALPVGRPPAGNGLLLPSVPKTDESKTERRRDAAPRGAADGKLTTAERKILTVLAQNLDGLSKAQVALMSGYSASSGGFRNSLSTLRVAGRLEGDKERFIITGKGVTDLGTFTPLPRGHELLEHWKVNAGDRCAREILTVLAATRGPLPKLELAERANYQASSGGFRNALSRLRTLGLIEGKGELGLTAAFARAIA